MCGQFGPKYISTFKLSNVCNKRSGNNVSVDEKNGALFLSEGLFIVHNPGHFQKYFHGYIF